MNVNACRSKAELPPRPELVLLQRMFRSQLLLPTIALVALVGATAVVSWRYHEERAYEAALERITQEVEQSRANAGDMAY